MKLLFSLFALLAVASAATTGRHPVPRLSAGQTYVYDYTSRLLSGIPALADQYAGLELEAQIVLQPQANTVAMKMTNVVIGKHNGPVGHDGQPVMDHQMAQEYSRELTKTIRFEYIDGKVKAFEADQSEAEWSLNMKKAILSLLNVNIAPKKIIKSVHSNQIFRPENDLTVFPVYEDGIGGQCETVYEINQIADPFAKDVDNAFVLNVTKTRNYDNCLTEPSIANDNFDTRGCPWVCRKEKSFAAVQGYYPTPDAVNDPYMSGCPCGHEPHESPVDAFSFAKYNISLQNSMPTIESVFAEGKVVYNTNGDQLVIITQQNLTLSAVGVANVNIQPIPRPQRHQELSFRIPKPKTGQKTLDIPYYHLFGNVQTQELKNLIPELINSLAEDIVSGEISATKESLQKSVQMVNALAVLPEEALKELFEELARPGQSIRATAKQQVVRKLFLDALPLAGSNPAAKYIKDLILQQLVSTSEAKELVEAVPQNLFLIDTETLDSYLELFTSEKVQSRRHLAASAGIAFGKMVKEACVKRQTTPGDIPDGQAVPHQIRSQEARQVIAGSAQKPRVTVSQTISQRMKRSSEWEAEFQQEVCSEADIAKYVQIIGRLLEEAKTFHQKVTLIETLAHMAVPHVLAVLEPYVSGNIHNCPGYATEKKRSQDEECDFLRQVAIYALSHVTEYYPKQVLPLVLPVYADQSEPYELRIAAFTTLVNAAPEQQHLERIAAELHRESNRQIRSFVYSSLQSIGNLTLPCYHKMAQYAAQAFEHAPESDYGMQYSKMIGHSFYDDQKDFGIDYQMEWTASNTSRVPRSAYVGVTQSSGPFNDALFQLGFNAKGMEGLLERALEPNGIIADMFEGLSAKGKDRRVTKRNADSAQQALEALKSKLKLRVRDDDEPKAAVFFKLFDRTSYYPLDKHYVHQLIDNVEDELKDMAQQLMQGMDWHYVKLLMPQQLYKVLPSEIGVPIVITHRHPIILSLKVDQAKLQLETAPKTVYPTGANITAQIQPSIFYSSYAFAFAVNNADRVAFGAHVEKTTQATFPVEISVGYSRPKNLLTWSVIPKTSQEVLYHKTQAKTFIAKSAIAGAPDQDWLQNSKDIKTMAVPFKHETTVGQDALGLGLRVQLNTEDPWATQPLYATEEAKENGIIAAAVQSWRNPGLEARELHVQLEADAEEPISGYDFTLRYKWIADDENGKDDDDSDESSQSSESDSDESDASSASKSSESKSSESKSSSESSSESKSSKSSEESNESKNLKDKIRDRMAKAVRSRRSVSAKKESNESSDESSNSSGSKSFSKSGSKESSQSSSSESKSSEEKQKKNKSKNSSASARSSESSSSSSESDESTSFEDKVFGYEHVMKLILGQDFKKRDIKRVAKELVRKTHNIWQNNWDEDYDSSSSDASDQKEETEVPATIAHDFVITAVARGPRPTFYAANVMYVHTYDHRIVWLKSDGHVKSPKGVYMTVPHLFCADAVVSYPTIPSDFYYERTQLQSQKAKLQAHLGWGAQCHEEGAIILTGVLESTEDRVITASDLAVKDGSVDDVENWYYRQCGIDRSEGKAASYACERALIEDAYFNQMIVDIKYKNIPKQIRNITEKAAMAAKVYFYDAVDIAAVDVKNAEEQIRVIAQYSSRIPDIALANIAVQTPRENTYFSRVHIPHVRPVSAFLPIKDVYSNLWNGYEAQDRCFLTGDHVRTFDNVTFETTESQCQFLLAKDCSPKERFAVFAQTLNAETQTKTVSVITQGSEIKLLPPQQQNVAQVVIDGHTHEVSFLKPLTLSGDGNDLRVYLRATPSEAVNPIIVVESDINDLEVLFDGKNAKVTLKSGQYKGKTCGLCGDNNDESDEEFVGADECVYDSAHDFVNSYALSGQHCEQTPVPMGPKRCPEKESSEESYEETLAIRTNGQTTLMKHSTQDMNAKDRHDVIQSQANAEELAILAQQEQEKAMARQNGQPLSPEQKQNAMGASRQQQQLIQRLRTQYIERDDMVCFTTRPVLSCVNATPSAVKQVKLDFHCLPKASPFTQQLIADSEIKILKQLANKRVDLRQVVDVPINCAIAA